MNQTSSKSEELLSAELTELDVGQTGAEPLFNSQHQRRIVNQVGVQLEACLGRSSMTIEQLFSLKQGELVSLDVQPGELVELRLNSELVARGELSVVGEHFAVKITELAD